MATAIPVTLQEKLDKIRSPNLQNQKQVCLCTLVCDRERLTVEFE